MTVKEEIAEIKKEIREIKMLLSSRGIVKTSVVETVEQISYPNRTRKVERV